MIAALSVCCAVLLIVTIWALANRNQYTAEGPVYWVALDGDDAAPGTSDEPWATLQKAADTAPPGAQVLVREGVYAQRVELHVSGEPGRPITFAPAPDATVVLDGSTMEVPSDHSAMITIDSERYLTVRGFEITGFESDESGRVPIGILVTGTADHIRLEGNFVHDMGTTFPGRNGGDAHGIGVFGTSNDHPIEEVEIIENELAHLTLGSSEALVVNGNVKDFLIEGNRVHDTNNIGIDVIGFEGTAPDPTVDQARDGIVRANTVWNVDSAGNPAYGSDRSADGIYVDGGRDILIEGNVVHDVNIGIELASEHAGRSTRNITARNNVVFDATAIGIAIGGYDRHRGSTEDCIIVNNTFVNTDGVELLVQFDTRNNVIANNVIVAGASARLRRESLPGESWQHVGPQLVLLARRQFGGDLAMEGRRLRRLRCMEGAIGERPHVDLRRSGVPRLQGRTTIRLGTGSPAVDAGAFLAAAGTTDIDGEPRAQAEGSTSVLSNCRRRRHRRHRRSPNRSPTPAT